MFRFREETLNGASRASYVPAFTKFVGNSSICRADARVIRRRKRNTSETPQPLSYSTVPESVKKCFSSFLLTSIISVKFLEKGLPVFSVKLLGFSDIPEEDAQQSFGATFGLPMERVGVIFSKIPCVLKSKLTQNQAEELAKKLQGIGAEVTLRDESTGEEIFLESPEVLETAEEPSASCAPATPAPSSIEGEATSSEEQSPSEDETPAAPDECPNCRAKKFEGEDSCPSCGIIFSKWNAYFDKV